MEGATEGWTKLRKGSPVGSRKVWFFWCYLWGSSLKLTVMRLKRFVIGNSSSMKGLDGGPIIIGGRIQLDRYGITQWRNRY